MIEVEMKVPVSGKEELKEKLSGLGFQKGLRFCETDLYFDNNEGTFRNSDKAIRIRKCENLTTGEQISCITYKGPKLDTISMTRKELEMKIENAEIGREILENLGFLPVLPVNKTRQYYHKERVTGCMDQVEGLGDFLELEVIVEEDLERDGALEEVLNLLGSLGYEKEDVIRTSYLSMLQKK